MVNCQHCVNGIVIIGNNSEACRYCMTRQKFIESLDKAIVKALKEDGNKASNLQAIRINLPDYPIMAALEAESAGLSEKFINMLHTSFDTRPFKDINYKQLNVVGGYGF